MDPDLRLCDGLDTRMLAADDAALLVEATSRETARSLWAGRPAGPYTLHEAQAALSLWDPAAQGQFSIGILREGRLLGAVGLMPDHPASIELAYWTRPEERGQGIASRAVQAVTLWAHRTLGASRVWLEINPRNQPSLRLAQRLGYHFEQRLPRHCRDWSSRDPEHDSWHDCLIWTHHSDRTSASPGPGHNPASTDEDHDLPLDDHVDLMSRVGEHLGVAYDDDGFSEIAAGR